MLFALLVTLLAAIAVVAIVVGRLERHREAKANRSALDAAYRERAKLEAQAIHAGERLADQRAELCDALARIARLEQNGLAPGTRIVAVLTGDEPVSLRGIVVRDFEPEPGAGGIELACGELLQPNGADPIALDGGGGWIPRGRIKFVQLVPASSSDD